MYTTNERIALNGRKKNEKRLAKMAHGLLGYLIDNYSKERKFMKCAENDWL